MGSQRVGHDRTTFTPCGASGKEPACYTGDTRNAGSIPWSRRPTGGQRSKPLQYSELENATDRGAWWATVQGSHRVRHNWSDLAHKHVSPWTKIICLVLKNNIKLGILNLASANGFEESLNLLKLCSKYHVFWRQWPKSFLHILLGICDYKILRSAKNVVQVFP